ncbi:ABC transporter ATP-binding protein [Actinomyces capricornis]
MMTSKKRAEKDADASAALPDPSAGAPLLEVTDLKVSFPSEDGRVNAVRGVNLSVARGEVLALVGESGSGKSVTSTAVMGLLDDSADVSGSIRLHGTELLGRSDDYMSKIRGVQLSMVFQDPLSALTPVYTVGGQIVEALRIHQEISEADAWKRAVELLDLVGIPNPEVRAKNYPHEFSGGMRQRAVIAIAIANNPDLIIADEPTTALDVTIQAQILDVLRTAQRETGAGVIMITHDLGVVAGLADRVAVMYAGRIVETGSVDEIFYRPAMPYTIGLLGALPRLDARKDSALATLEGNPPSLLSLPPGCPFAPRCPLADEGCTSAEPGLVALADLPGADSLRTGATELPEGGVTAGHRTACVKSAQILGEGLDYTDIFPVPSLKTPAALDLPRAEREEVLRVTDMVKEFPLLKGAVFKRRVGTVHAVDGVSFDVREGETLALVGESGCGKTTSLMEVLSLSAPQEGTIVVLGKDTRELGRQERKRVRRDLQIVFQDPMASLDPRLPIFDIIAEPLRHNGWAKADIPGRIEELMSLVGLEPSHANRYPRNFSGGQRQRIGIARALALEPRLLVLDEPVSALDVSIQAGVINLLDELRATQKLSYLFVAHDLSVVRHIADRVAVMYLGKIVEIGDVDSVFEAPAHPYTQALLSAIPIPDPAKERGRERIILEGDLPSPANPPSGCRFRTRCPKFSLLNESQQAQCLEAMPEHHSMGPDHEAACYFPEHQAVF